MPRLTHIYLSDAPTYEDMIIHEDYMGNLWPAIEAISDPARRDVIELGAGTGRLTRRLAPVARSLVSADLSHHMLRQAQVVLRGRDIIPRLVMGDHRRPPFASHAADVMMQGWSFTHLKLVAGDDWQSVMAGCEAQIDRLLRPGGTMLHIETLGAGVTEPTIPDRFRDLYDWWESRGYAYRWIRTDFRFPDRATAERLTTYFFGEEITEAFVPDGEQIVLPMCTGLWSRQV